MSEEGGSKNYELQIVRGLPFPAVKWFNKKNIEDALDYMPQDGDIIIASYPKTGTTWLQYIVLQILSKGDLFPSFDDVTYHVVPFMEMTGIAAVEALRNPRVYKHHIPYNMVQKNPKSKCLYIYRNPEDTVVSFFHFMQNMQEEEKNFSDFFEQFLTGNIGYGRYFEHILSFLEHKDDENLLLISYEKLHKNRKEEILRIAKFLGENYFQRLLEDESVIRKVIEHTSFDYMKKNLTLTHPQKKDEGEGLKTVAFFRKGIVGDGKKMLSTEQQKRLREVAEKVMDGTEVIKEWMGE
ncbi:sulfotransferase family cytosolic 1B member 1-like [Stegodyphus dumicola]|uniref:sulfotransferase family cytosolic 1B member 1-like n=1 Tax=Stegodyphus dumicola TaxID=202533 RepID=UPI0015B1B5F4|nr:sulfotransferase family cytosolic 1B member 1-like [Stegodyphus dumicola]